MYPSIECNDLIIQLYCVRPFRIIDMLEMKTKYSIIEYLEWMAHFAITMVLIFCVNCSVFQWTNSDVLCNWNTNKKKWLCFCDKSDQNSTWRNSAVFIYIMSTKKNGYFWDSFIKYLCNSITNANGAYLQRLKRFLIQHFYISLNRTHSAKMDRRCSLFNTLCWLFHSNVKCNAC